MSLNLSLTPGTHDPIIPQNLALTEELAEQWRSVRRHWRLVLFCAFILPAIAALALSRQPTLYTATGTMLYNPIDFAPRLLRGVELGDRGTDAVMASQSAVLTSADLAHHIAVSLNLAANPIYNPTLRKRSVWQKLTGQHPKQPDQDDLTEEVQRQLAAQSISSSRILQVSFTSPDAALAARAANLAMTLYLDRQLQSRFAALQTAQDWLTQRARAVQQQLAATQSKIAQAQAKAGLSQGAQASLSDETASRLTEALVSARTALAESQARVETLSGPDQASDDAAIAPELLPLRSQESDLQAQLGALTTSFGPHYPQVIQVQRSLARVQAQIADAIARQIAASRAAAHAAAAQVASLQAMLDRTRQNAARESFAAAPINGLQQQAGAEQSLLRGLTEQMETLASQNALAQPDARILSPAFAPHKPSAPHRLLILAGSGLLGLTLGLFAAFAAEALDGTFRSGGEIRSSLGLACFALLPEIPKRLLAGQSIAAYARSAPFSPFAEQLRALRASLWLGRTGRQIIAVTAARPDEGKTTLTIGLAIAAARSGEKILAIDCDVRQPSFETTFNLGGAPGLTDYLAGRARFAEIIHIDPGSGLAIIPAGTIAFDALSLFMSDAMTQLMAELRSAFDLILLDVPPAFALAEARVLAHLADAALLCVRWHDTPRRVVMASLTLLHEANVRIIGTALTRVDPAAHSRSGFPDAELYHPRYGGYFRG